MNQINHEVLKDILDLLVKSHTGKQGGGYGCMPKAAQIAVDTFGRGWISPQRGNPFDKWLYEFFRCSIKVTCPPNSNVDKAVGDFFGYAKAYEASLNAEFINTANIKMTASDLLMALE
jgi:hypothetical protein